MSNIKKTVFGLAITLLISIVSYLTSSLHPSFDLLVISIIFGMLVSSIIGDRSSIEPGIELATKLFLPLGIGLYGMQVAITGVSFKFLPLIATTSIITFFVTYFISRGIGIDKEISIMLSAGMSICGASAIVVIAPLILAKKEDVSISLISLLTVGLTGMLVFKMFHNIVTISPEDYALMSATTLPMFGQVRVAALAMGDEALKLAVNLKLIRIAMLIFVAIGVLIYGGKKRTGFPIPWFMFVFFGLAVAVNTSKDVASFRSFVAPIGQFSLSTALAAIGLSIDIEVIMEKGSRPLLAAFLSWSIIVLMLYLTVNVINV